MGTVNIEIMLKGDAIMKENKKIIPIFYACDTNYLPYLSVSLISLLSSFHILDIPTQLTPHIKYTFCSDCDTIFQIDSCLYVLDMGSF